MSGLLINAMIVYNLTNRKKNAVICVHQSMQNFSDSCFPEDSKDMYNNLYYRTAIILFFSLNLLFGDVLIAIVIMVCLLSCPLFLCILVHYFKLFDACNDDLLGFI